MREQNCSTPHTFRCTFLSNCFKLCETFQYTNPILSKTSQSLRKHLRATLFDSLFNSTQYTSTERRETLSFISHPHRYTETIFQPQCQNDMVAEAQVRSLHSLQTFLYSSIHSVSIETKRIKHVKHGLKACGRENKPTFEEFEHIRSILSPPTYFPTWG